MLKTILTSLICILALSLSAQEYDLYRVHNTKYVHGGVAEAIEIGMKYFQKAYEAIGINVQVYRYSTGPWDSQVIIPIKSDEHIKSAFFGPSNKGVYEELVKLTGSAEKLKEITDRFNELVLSEEHHLMHKIAGM